MRRIVTVLAAILMASTFAFAQATVKPAPKAKPSKPTAAKPLTASGAITKADATTATLATKDGEKTFVITSTTKITVDGKQVPGTALKDGLKGTVNYTQTGGQLTATKIAVRTAARKGKNTSTPKK